MKTLHKLDSVRRQAWLAGIGAADTGREIAADKFDKMFVDSSAFIGKLFTLGESLEVQLQAKLRGGKMMDDKIAFLREKLGLRRVSRDQQLESLSAKVDTLIDMVAKLALQKAAMKPAAKVAARAVDKPVEKTAAKPVAKARSKPAAKATAKPAAKATAKPVTKTAAKPVAKVVASEGSNKPEETKTDQ